MRHITITGDLGSGKSAVSRLIVENHGYKPYSTGSAQRKLAEQLGITTLELNQRAETDPSIDERIDGIFRELRDAPEKYVIDSRMAWHFLPESLKVKLMVDARIAAERIMHDPKRERERYPDIETTIAQLAARRHSEVTRFKRYYGVDLNDLSNYDLVIDTSARAPQEIEALIIGAL
jgi:cytidylate kinase